MARSAPLPVDESERLAALRSLGVQRGDHDPALDAVTALAALLAGTPIALVSLVDEKSQWFLSKVGLEAHETQRSEAFCAHAILDPESVMQVEDATLDTRFHDNPLVAGDPNIRFYAGVPLRPRGGRAIGTLCVIDREPREVLTPPRENALRSLALLAEELLLSRAVRTETEAALATARSLESLRTANLRDLDHDARTPLAAIRGYAELILANRCDERAVRDYAVSVTESVDHLAGLLGATLRLHAHEEVTAEERRAHLAAEVARSLKLARPAAAGLGVTITCESDEEVEVGLTPVRLRQVLVNLLSNAVKYNRTEGRVTVSWQVNARDVRLTIADTGVGIPDGAHDQVFERGYRAPSARESAIPGDGHGLHVVKTLLARAGGDIEARAARPHGTIMRMTIPRAAPSRVAV